MLDYTQIKDVIVNKLGITDLKAYKKWAEQYFNGKKITLSDVELLSPENIDNTAFWRIAEELFGIDGVCNTMHGTLPSDIESGNRRNISLARHIGSLTFIDDWKNYSLPILEIGAGYGSFKNYVEATTHYKYTGVDVYPKIPGVLSTYKNGLLPNYIRFQKFHIIYSSNVFQHLSSYQRTRYYQDINSMMTKDSIFIFNLLTEDEINCEQSEDGRFYMRHYGQFTEVPKIFSLREELQKYFYILYETRRIYDRLFGFICHKKELAISTIRN